VPLTIAVIVQPAAEPVSLAQAKIHCRVDHTADDALLTSLIVAARQWCEQIMRRSIMTQTRTLSLDDWPNGMIQLPFSKAQSIVSIQYYDQNSNVQTLPAASYYTDLISEPARISFAPATTLPVAEIDRINSITVTYVAGYGDASDVPQAISQAILLLVGHWYENREASIVAVSIADVPMATTALLSTYRISWI